MIEVLKLHWKFLSKPSESINKYFSEWPISLGIYVYVFFMVYAYLQTGDTYRRLYDMLSTIYGVKDELFVFFYIALTILYSIFIYSKIMPLFLKKFSNVPSNEFNSENYQRAIFYSPISFVIYTIVVILPLQVVFSFLLLNYDLGYFVIGYGVLYGFLGIWGLVLLINMYVVQWKAIKIFYKLDSFKTFLLIFLIPLIFAIPLLFIYGQRLVEYIKYSMR